MQDWQQAPFTAHRTSVRKSEPSNKTCVLPHTKTNRPFTVQPFFRTLNKTFAVKRKQNKEQNKCSEQNIEHNILEHKISANEPINRAWQVTSRLRTQHRTEHLLRAQQRTQGAVCRTKQRTRVGHPRVDRTEHPTEHQTEHRTKHTALKKHPI